MTLLAAILLSTPLWADPTINSVITNGLFDPYGIAVDATNNYYITDNTHCVFKFPQSSGLLTTMAGLAGQPGYVNGPGFLARFYSPKGAAVYRGGLVVADSGNHLLRFLTLSGSISIVSTFAGVTNTPGSAANATRLTATFNSPLGLATDSSNNLFIADSKNNAVRKLDTNDNVTTIASSLFEPQGVAVDLNGVVYVADTRDQTIVMLTPQPNGTYVASTLAGSPGRPVGTNDDYFATNTRFNLPEGLFFVSTNTGLIVSDTYNHTLRRVYPNPDLTAYYNTGIVWSVATYAGTPQTPGLVDGLVSAAKLNAPSSLVTDANGNLLVVDEGNNAIRRVQLGAVLPQMPDPTIGYVTMITNTAGDVISKLVKITDSTFYNDQTIAVLADPNTVSWTSGPTPGLFQPDTIPVPTPNLSQTAPYYFDGMRQAQLPPTLVSSQPDVTIKAIATAPNRTPSHVIQARIEYIASTPNVNGDNPFSFLLVNATTNAQMWYTTNAANIGTNNLIQTNVSGTFGPVASGSTISVPTTNVVTFYAQAFKPGYQPSTIVAKTFYQTNFTANRLIFGFASGEGSSAFVGGQGQTFFAPVTLSLLANQAIYGMQFNIGLTNNSPAPAVSPSTVGFVPMLVKPGSGGSYVPITPSLVNISPPPSVTSTNFSFTNSTSAMLLGLGWFERYTFTNLYNTLAQDLITYSMAHDTLFGKGGGQVVVGAFRYVIPATAAIGQSYYMQLNRPSANSDGIGGPTSDVFIDTPTSGSLGSGNINAAKNVTVGQIAYLVGDVAPFRWLNAGDFGDSSLLDNDVQQIFNSAVYGLNIPPASSDFFDAMDTCCSPGAGNLFDGNDLTINNMSKGDGVLDVRDVFVVFRRSLDPSLTNYLRYWSGGVRTAVATNNLFRGRPELPARRFSVSKADLPANLDAILKSTDPPTLRVGMSDVPAQPGQTVSVPIIAQITGKYPVRILGFNLKVEPLEGSPPVVQPIKFTPAPGLGVPDFSDSRSPANYAAAWLHSWAAGVWAEGRLGTLQVTVPANAGPRAAYRITVSNLSASPNGYALFPRSVQAGLLTLSDRQTSSLNDGIPDAWRLRYFGSVSDPRSAAAADPDGDGVPNWAEYQAGTDPLDPQSALRVVGVRLATSRNSGLPGIVLHWSALIGRRYVVEASPTLGNQGWTTLSPNLLGAGQDLEYVDLNPSGANRYYRVRLAD